ncbi:bifunctional folylpolyglutamate synthase/dihydrofolate synthase [Companilactobacillus huachuanensis]|uniref:tetrahydrofolate synthase n=1 Tax=Companilactobacillus huachuanensis TaxID=2559914 RepID=A0ABW1RNT2_9LACO|nr:Mur ligase family protein [Companilactobacillus huachuanensis]
MSEINFTNQLPQFLYNKNDRISLLKDILNSLGNPDQQYKIIHVCGTNGKGSTSTMIAKLLSALKYKTGLFTSPHIENITERIKIDGKNISENIFKKYEKKIIQKLKELNIDITQDISYFEMLFLISVLYFSEQDCNYVVLECGLGGELDATNAINESKFTIFTKIGMDHTAILGSTLGEIIDTKIKIVRKNSTVVMAPNQRELSTLKIQEECDLKKVKLLNSEKEINYLYFSSGKVIAKTNTGKFEFSFPLNVNYQKENLRTALTWYQAFCTQNNLKFDPKLLNIAFSDLSINGRFEILKKKPLVIVDVAHNVDGVQMFKECINDKYLDFQKTIVVGFLKDKDVSGCCNILSQIKAKFILTEPINKSRALHTSDLSIIFDKSGSKHSYKTARTPSMAIDMAIENNIGTKKVIFVVGSFYLVNKVRTHLRKVD